MSVSLWAWTDECDGRICTGDCDLCSYEEESEEECCDNCKFCYPLEHRLPQETEWEWSHVCTALAYGDDGFAMQIDNPSEDKCEIFTPRKEREE